uniref:CREG-like beta-barrel domain-containing protein n=1 Tax=Oryza barthii TaxID=65489 RepID=A0A0D3GEP3_9ORYZ
MLPPAHLLVVAVGAALLLAFRPPLPALAARPIVAAAGGKPAPTEAAATARWLAAQNTWGVLRLSPSQFLCRLLARDPLLFGGTDCTISSDLSGAPFGNVVSYSDGVPGESHGIPYFYLTTLDPTARDALEDERTSFTLSEFPLGTCGKIDPENPTCAKLTLTGKLKLIDPQSSEADLAKEALFTKHPEMEGWPKNHHFQIFKLEIKNIFLIDWFGGPKPISPTEYLEYEKNRALLKSS